MFKVDGFDKLQKRLKDLENAAKELDGENSVSFGDLFTETFMNKYTSFASFEELLSAGNFNVKNNDDFEAIPENDLDTHVAKVTKFSNWKEMLNSAAKEHVARKLGF